MTDGSDRDLLSAQSHFAFGRNWASYAELIGGPQIIEVERGMDFYHNVHDWLGEISLRVHLNCRSGRSHVQGRPDARQLVPVQKQKMVVIREAHRNIRIQLR